MPNEPVWFGHLQKLPPSMEWREFVPLAIERHLRFLVDGSELQARAQITEVRAARGFK